MPNIKIIDYVYQLERRNKNSLVNDILKRNRDAYLRILHEIQKYNEDFETIAYDEPADKTLPHWDNQWFSSYDACSIYYLISKYKPKYYLEVGSGNSTKFAKLAVNNRSPETKIISIDPQPRAEIDQICDEVIRERFENVDLKSLDYLSENDIVFIDNSHRSLQNSDVTVFFTEFLPILPKGLIFGLHDIFLPYDYPEGWETRLYSEQYMLATYLLSGQTRDTIFLPVHYVSVGDDPELARAAAEICPEETFGSRFRRGAACFWMRRDVEPELALP